MTGEQMCETIAWVYNATTGETIAPETIWTFSPSGELYPMLELFDTAAWWISTNIGPPAL